MLIARDASPAPELNMRQRLAVVALDVAMVAEVTLAVYLASRSADDFTAAFLKIFFAMLLPTLALALFAIRRLRDKDEASPGRVSA